MKRRNNFLLTPISSKTNKNNSKKQVIHQNTKQIKQKIQQNSTKNKAIYDNTISDEEYYKRYYIVDDNNNRNTEQNVSVKNISEIANVDFSVSCISDEALENDIKNFYNRIYDLSNLLKTFNTVAERITREQILYTFDDIFKTNSPLISSILNSAYSNYINMSSYTLFYSSVIKTDINERLNFIGNNFIYDVFFESDTFKNIIFYNIQDKIFTKDIFGAYEVSNIFEVIVIAICTMLFLTETYLDNNDNSLNNMDYIDLYNNIKTELLNQFVLNIIESSYEPDTPKYINELNKIDIIFDELVAIFTKYRDIHVTTITLDKNDESKTLNYTKTTDNIIEISYNVNVKASINNDKDKQLVYIKNSDDYNLESVYVYIEKNSDNSINITESKDLPYIIGIENDTNFKFDTSKQPTASELLQINIHDEVDVFSTDKSLEDYVNEVSLNFTNGKDVNNIPTDDIVNGIISIFSLIEISPQTQALLNNIPFIGLLFILNINDTMNDIITKSKEVRGSQTNSNVGINVEKGFIKGLNFILNILEKSYRNALKAFLDFKVNEDTQFKLYANYIDELITPRALLQNSIPDIVNLVINFLNKTCALVEDDTFDELNNTVKYIVNLIITLIGGNVNIDKNIGELLNEPIETNYDGTPYDKYSDFFDTSLMFKSELDIKQKPLH